jgi:hypothetical protein
MAGSVLVSIPLEFFRSVVGHSLSNEELGVYLRLYAQAVESRTEHLTREVLILDAIDNQSVAILSKLKDLGLLETLDNNGVRVVGCSENHKRLDFDGLKKKAKEGDEIPYIPIPLQNLNQLNTNADLCNRFQELMKSWQQTYPQVDIPKELIKANNWLTNNPKIKRPNKVRFLGHWLRKAQSYAERRGATGGTGADSPMSQWEGIR